MSYDDLDKKIISIKKRGLSKMLELNLISQARGEYYGEKIDTMEKEISTRFFQNLEFLSRMHRSFPSSSNVKDFMGVAVDQYYASVMRSEERIFSIRHVLIVSQYYGIPIQLLLFNDLELYGERIRTEYPTFFKQS